MTIIIHEIKKIIEPKRLGIVGIFYLIFFFWMGANPFTPNANWNEPVAAVYFELIDTFGMTMTRQDAEAFQETIPQAIETFNAYLQTRPDLLVQGATTFEEFRTLLNDWDFFLSINRDEVMAYFQAVGTREHVISRFEWREQGIAEANARRESGHYTSTELARLEELFSRTEHSIFPEQVFAHYQQMIMGAAGSLIFSLMVLLSPLYIRERKQHMLELQYTTKIGRKLFLKKLGAISLVTLLLTTLHLGLIFMLYSQMPIGIFLPMNINTIFVLGRNAWYDLTFGQYIALTVGLIYVLSLLSALLTLFISRLSPNYLTVTGIQAVLSIAMIANFFFSVMLSDSIMMFFNQTGTANPPALVPSLYAGLITLTVGLLTFQWQRERKLDL